MTGAGRLIRLILRRDRFLLPFWVLPLGLLPVATYASFEGLLPTDAERVEFARVGASNAGFVSLYGPLHGDSYAALTAWRVGFVPVMIGLFALLMVIRHTRTDEEAGRAELIGSTVVGRHAPLAAALSTACGFSIVLGLLTFVSMAGKSSSVAGSFALGASFAAAGCMFATVAAITAQLTSSARAARSIAIVVLGVSYALRVGGDISALGTGSLSWLSWISPLGWLTRVFPYGSRNWWPLVLAALFLVVATAVAVYLRGRRDLGDGLFAARLGRASAAASLGTPLALAWRLHRGLLVGWTFGLALLGLVFGGVGGSVLDIAQDNKGLSDIFHRLGGSSELIDSYFAGTASIVGLIAACYGVQATLRLRDEETTGHAETVLATSVSRYAWALSHLLFSLLGPALALFAEGLVAGLTYGSGDLGPILGGTMLQLPAVWVLAGVTVLLFGLLPRWSLAAWAAPGICLLILLMGETLRLNQRLLDISPFTHTPRLPGGHVSATPVVALLTVAVVLGVTGIAALRRRNMPE